MLSTLLTLYFSIFPLTWSILWNVWPALLLHDKSRNSLFLAENASICLITTSEKSSHFRGPLITLITLPLATSMAPLPQPVPSVSVFPRSEAFFPPFSLSDPIISCCSMDFLCSDDSNSYNSLPDLFSHLETCLSTQPQRLRLTACLTVKSGSSTCLLPSLLPPALWDNHHQQPGGPNEKLWVHQGKTPLPPPFSAHWMSHHTALILSCYSISNLCTAFHFHSHSFNSKLWSLLFVLFYIPVC